MRKLVWNFLVTGFVAAVTTVWAHSPAFTKRTPAIAETTGTISPEALQRRIDVNSLPVLEASDLF